MAAQCGKMEVCNTLLKMRADANATDVVSFKVFVLRHVEIPTNVKPTHGVPDNIKEACLMSIARLAKER
jgi:hypothetical protein